MNESNRNLFSLFRLSQAGRIIRPRWIRSAFDRLKDRRAQAGGIKRSLDSSSAHERDQSGLLRNHDGYGIRIFGDAQRCAMARAQILRQLRIQRKQEAAAIRSPRTTIAPSCNGEAGLKIATIKS